MRLSPRSPAAALLLATLTASSGCTLFLLRDLGLEAAIERASATGRLVRADEANAPAAFAQVALPGSARATRANSDGAFVVRGLAPGSWALRLVDDPDGDGWADRAGLQRLRVALSPHATSPADAVVGGGEVDVTGVDLGDIPLEPSGVIDGHVTVQGGALPPGVVGRVAVVRAVDFPDGELFVLGAELSTHVDDEGRFFAAGLVGGEAQVVALAYTVDDLGQIQELRGISDPVTVTVGSDGLDAPLDIGTLDIPRDVSTPLSATTTVALALAGEVSADAYVMIAPPGRPFPPCEEGPVDYAGTQFSYVLQSDLIGAGSGVLNVEVPLGAVDLQVCSGAQGGELRGQVVSASDEVPLLGPIAIGAGLGLCETLVRVEDSTCTTSDDCDGEGAVCLGTGERSGVLGSPVFACFAPIYNDCDGDGIPGLPLREGPTEALWTACGITALGPDGEVASTRRCGGLRGDQLADATCTYTGDDDYAGDYDCDDDGDGQADVNEPDCYGPGLGTDLDKDGLCSGADPFPLCRANTPEACDAEQNDAALPPPGLVDPPVDGGVVEFDSGAPDLDGGTQVGEDGGSFVLDAGGTDLDGGGTGTLGEIHLSLDTDWATAGTATLPYHGTTGGLGPARIITAGGRAYVIDNVTDGGVLTMLWTLDPELPAPTGIPWGTTGGNPAIGDGVDLVVDFVADPPVPVMARTTVLDVDSPEVIDPEGNPWPWLQRSVLNADGSVGAELPVFDQATPRKTYVDAGDPVFEMGIGAYTANGVVQQASTGDMWLFGTHLSTNKAVFAWRERGELVLSSDALGPDTTTEGMRHVITATVGGQQRVYLPGVNEDGLRVLTSFNLTSQTWDSPPLFFAGGNGDLALDGFTDGAVRQVGPDGTPELVLVGRDDGNNTLFLQRVPLDGSGSPLGTPVSTAPINVPGAPLSLYAPRVAVLGDTRVLIAVVGAPIPGDDDISYGTLLLVDNAGTIEHQLDADGLADGNGFFTDVHPSPLDDGSFLVSRYAADQHAVSRVVIEPGPAPLTDGGVAPVPPDDGGSDVGLP